MSARKHPNRMPAATLWWLPAFLSRYGLFTVYEIFVNFLCQTPTILVIGMCIEICYHPCLRVSGVTLNGFDVAAANLKL